MQKESEEEMSVVVDERRNTENLIRFLVLKIGDIEKIKTRRYIQLLIS